jgi:hypothetical protein
MIPRQTEHKPLNWEDPLPIGRHKGRTVGDVAADQTGIDYLHWMMNNTTIRFAEYVEQYLDSEVSE